MRPRSEEHMAVLRAPGRVIAGTAVEGQEEEKVASADEAAVVSSDEARVPKIAGRP